MVVLSFENARFFLAVPGPEGRAFVSILARGSFLVFFLWSQRGSKEEERTRELHCEAP